MSDLSPSMTLLQIVELHPDTVEIFRHYEQTTGSCLLCNNLFDSLASVALQYNLDLDDLLKRLQSHMRKRSI